MTRATSCSLVWHCSVVLAVVAGQQQPMPMLSTKPMYPPDDCVSYAIRVLYVVLAAPLMVVLTDANGADDDDSFVNYCCPVM